jgi:hypothetical protein
METIKYIWFHNETEVPIMIESWVDGSTSQRSLKVSPGEKLIIHSSVGEWHINSMFRNETDFFLWKETGLEAYVSIGKFRSQPCSKGDYVWFYRYDDVFDCKYSKVEEPIENIKGLITFSRINELPFILK